MNSGGLLLIKGIKVSPVVDCINLTVEGENLSALGETFNLLGQHQINIWFEVHLRDDDDTIHSTLCIDPTESEKAIGLVREIAPEISISKVQSLNILSVFPFRDSPETASFLFQTLTDLSIPVLAASTSLSSLSCLIHSDHCSLAQESLKRAFRILS
jgi:aspartokinase